MNNSKVTAAAVIFAFVGCRSTLVHAQQNEVVVEVNEQIEELIVTAHKRDYIVESAKTALGLDLDILETPAAVSVISQDLLKDLQVNNVDEALRNVPGATKYKTGNGGQEVFSIRGFSASQSIYKDGARINNRLNVTIIPSTETANIERIEVLKGPAGLLYGEGEPGGVINYITKRPQTEPYNNIEVLAGSDDFYKVEFDTTSALTEDGRFAYRLVGAYEDSESFRDEMFRERLLLNPSFSYRPNEKFELLLRAEYIDDNYTQTRGQVLDGNLVTGYFYSDRLDSSLFFGIPGFNDQTEAESLRVQAVVDYEVNDNWRVEATYSHTENDKLYFDAHPTFISPQIDLIAPIGSGLDNLVNISGANSSDGIGKTSQVTFKNFLDFKLFSIDHEMLLSYTYEELSSESIGFRSPDSVFYNIATDQYFFGSPFNPVDRNDIQISLAPSGSGVIQDINESGINFVDFITLNDQFKVLIGGRYSEYEDKINNFEDDNFSARGGLVYMPQDELSFYISYAEGYTTSAGNLDINDNVIDPETSESYELGVKWEPIEGQLLVTGAIYDTEKRDLAFLVNPFAAPIDYRYGNLGAVRSKGLELEIVGKISENWRIQAGYSYIDNEITRGGTTGSFGPLDFSFIEGNTLAGIAEHNYNVTSFYELGFGSGALGFGGAIYGASDSFISGENKTEIDGWTQVDLAMYYKLENWKFQFNVRNVFDEEYQLTQALVNPDVFAAIRADVAAPTTVVGSISYEF